MNRRWVVNTSPLILLDKVGKTDLLRQLCDELVVPQVVLSELSGRSEGRRLAAELVKGASVSVGGEHPIPTTLRAWDLGPGESQVLTLAAAEPVSRAVLDDREARRCAAAIGVPVIGTLGIVLRAERLGLVDDAQGLIRELRAVGLYVSDELIAQVLARFKT